MIRWLLRDADRSSALVLIGVGALCSAGVWLAGAAGCRTEFGGAAVPDGGTDSSTRLCGDGVVQSGEECDDGNGDAGDGCDPACLMEPGWRCEGEPSSCETSCGDGIRDSWEECDGSDLGGQTCESIGGGYSGGELSCSPDCRLDTFDCDLPSCGDGVLDLGEECDEGVENSNQGRCLSNCRLAVCGDGLVWQGVEECDEGAGNSDTEPDACRTSCQSPTCGDGVVDSGEECDEGAGRSDTEPDACRTSCDWASCGDGVLDSGEECDEGAANSDTEPDACRTSCGWASCGDGVLDSGEECDEGAGNSDTEPDACRTSCEQPTCGDGVLDSGEECDEGTANSDTEPGVCRTSCELPPPFWSYTHWRVDSPNDSGCTHWGKIADVRFFTGGSFLPNGATGYSAGTVAEKSIVEITHSGDSSTYGPAWQAFDGTGDPWQKYSGGSFYWHGDEFIAVEVAEPIVAERVRVGGFWGSATCVRLSASNDGVHWQDLGTGCNTDCNAFIWFEP
jgi:cysteine-rich repeat protein